jgi:2-octaprenyl-6-methoxyphenol hydroxylase
MNPPDYDVLVVGGGLVGASLACALHGSGLRVALAEASAGAAAPPPSFDERNLALARASCNALQALGVWSHLASPPGPIRRIHVSSRGDFGAVRLDAGERGVDDFGAIVIARELGAALEARLAALDDLDRMRPARVIGLKAEADRVVVQLDRAGQQASISTRLLVAADGTESSLRDSLGIAVERHDYAQTLFVASVQPARAHADTAYERFTDSGPVALLPRADGSCGSICTVASERADQVAGLDDEEYRELLQERFGWRLGRLGRVGQRSAYRLQRVVAQAVVAPRAVLVGNAAQTVHPIGAQGFNLGLRDALTLAEELIVAYRADIDPGDPDVLARYARRRRVDREATLALSDGLVRVFANRFAPLRALRSIGLLALERIPGLADDLVTGAMGYRGDVPALSRGVVSTPHRGAS